tara:strand:- start:1469 stop:1717 length:249 start_codon:yes stop_codon:yes gene_type:complete
MENNIRNDTILNLQTYGLSNSKSIEVENGIFNFTTKMANKNDISINWNNYYFKKIYYDKYGATLSILDSARKLELTGVNIYG